MGALQGAADNSRVTRGKEVDRRVRGSARRHTTTDDDVGAEIYLAERAREPARAGAEDEKKAGLEACSLKGLVELCLPSYRRIHTFITSCTVLMSPCDPLGRRDVVGAVDG